MRDLRLLEKWRKTHPMLGRGDSRNAYLVLPYPVAGCERSWLHCIATAGEAGWDHVSVTVQTRVTPLVGGRIEQERCPTWEEMEHVRRALFHETETVMQLHPPLAEYVNHHPYCLHLWRPTDREVPRPAMVYCSVDLTAPSSARATTRRSRPRCA